MRRCPPWTSTRLRARGGALTPTACGEQQQRTLVPLSSPRRHCRRASNRRSATSQQRPRAWGRTPKPASVPTGEPTLARAHQFCGAASWGCGPQPELRLVPRRAVYARTPPVGDGPPFSRDSRHTHICGQHAAPATGVGPDTSRSATLRFRPASAGRQGARAARRLRSRPHRKRQPTQQFRRRKKTSRPTQIASMVRLPKHRPMTGRPNRRVP